MNAKAHAAQDFEVVMRRLNLGCGLIAPDDWVNLDGSWNARLAAFPFLRRILAKTGIIPTGSAGIKWSSRIVRHDVRRRLPFADASFHAVYASHLLEHLYRDQARRLIKDCWRVLDESGVVRIVVPDLQAIVREYIEKRVDSETYGGKDSADIFCRRLGMHGESSPAGSLPWRLYTAMTRFHSHKWMYDTGSLGRLLAEAGFVDVQRKALHESRIEGIQAVELPERFTGGLSLCMEGIRPACDGGCVR